MQGDDLERDDKLRRRIRLLQSADLHHSRLRDLEELSDGLSAIGSKLPYQLEVNRLLFRRALAEGERLLAARVLAASYLMDSVVNGEEEEAEGDGAAEWEDALRAQIVRVGQKLHQMPPTKAG